MKSYNAHIEIQEEEEEEAKQISDYVDIAINHSIAFIIGLIAGYTWCYFAIA